MKFLRLNYWLMAAVMMIVAVACGEDPVNPEPEPDPKPNPDPKVESVLTLAVSPTTIVADGEEAASFNVTLTVKEEGKEDVVTDVTADADIFCQTTETTIEGDFKTTVAGDYAFVAMYEELTSNVAEVEATEPQVVVDPSTDHENVPTPIKWSVNHALPNDPTAGVEIEVTGIQEKNFQFVCRPGELVQSYRLDVFPLCRLYNSLFEQCVGGDETKKAEWDAVEEAILSFVFNSTGSGGFIMSPATQGDEYAEYEYDWMNTQYSQAKVVPHSEYVIVAVGCFDEDGTEAAEMTICYVQTPGEELIGDPHVYIQVEAGYRSFIVDNLPNDDCHYMYYWCSNEDDLMPYINGYGTKQYIDFMRHTLYDPIPAAAPADPNNDPRSYYMNFGQSASSDFNIMATAIALDENETPAEDFDSRVFTLKPIPELEEGEAVVTIDESRIAAHLFWYDVTIDANAHSMLMKIMTPEEAERYKDADEATLRELALQINDDGWGINNRNYSTDAEGNPNGSSYTTSSYWMSGPNAGGLQPGASYVLAYIARNAATELSTPKFTEPFTMDQVTKDNPEACKSDARLILTSNDRQKLHFSFENDDIENTAAVYFQYIEPYIDGGNQPSRDADRSTFIEWLCYDMFTNFWPSEPNIGCGEYTMIMEPGTKFVYAYVVEDWDGVLSEVRFAECATEEIVGGENPAVTIYYSIEDGVCYVTFSSNNDTERMKYMTGGVDVPGLGLSLLGDEDEMSGEEMYATWQLYCAEYGLQTNSISTSQPMELHGTAKEPTVALALAYGRDASGREVVSDLAYLIYDGGDDIKTLADYYASYSGKSVPVRSSIVIDKKPAIEVPAIPARQGVQLPASQMKRTAGSRGVVKDIVEQQESVRYIWLDMNSLGEHPHAVAR